jgi:hypothetical protein
VLAAALLWLSGPPPVPAAGIVANQVVGPDCETPIVSGGHNLDRDGTCSLAATGDQPHTDPLLGPLQDNRGPTWIHALLPGSPAVNAGTNPDCPATDQRGITRPQGPPCDIGAFEFDLLLAAVAIDGAEFEMGQTITYEGIMNPGLDLVRVNIYLGALLPDLVTFLSLVEVAPGQVGVVIGTVPVPYRSNVPAESRSVKYEYPFGGGEPVGTYFAYAAGTVAGSNPLLPQNQLSLAVQPFGFKP